MEGGPESLQIPLQHGVVQQTAGEKAGLQGKMGVGNGEELYIVEKAGGA